MLTRRTLTSLVAVTALAVPGLAIAPSADDPPSDPETTVEEDDGHGDVISALATCLPSGAELHGTGLTKGSIISQVASTGGYAAADGDEPTPVTTPEEAEFLCQQVKDQVATANEADEAPDRAKGRPDWAGPKDDEDEDEDVAASSDDDPEVEESRGRGGPPDHARARGRG